MTWRGRGSPWQTHACMSSDGDRSTSARHAAIAAALREQISSGALRAGAKLDSESDLSARYAVSRGTVRQALAALRSEGLISGGRGRRPVIARPAMTQSFDQLVSFTAWAERMGRRPGARTLELSRRPVPADVARQLDLAPGTDVFTYRRLRLLDDEPVMLERSTFVAAVGRLLLDCDLDAGSVYAQLTARGIVFAEAHQTITAIAASAGLAELLAVGRRAPLLEVRRQVLDAAGDPIEFSLDTYRGDAFAVTVQNRSALPRAGISLALVQDGASPASDHDESAAGPPRSAAGG